MDQDEYLVEETNNDAAIAEIVTMGYTDEQAKIAFKKTGTNDVETAVVWLLDNADFDFKNFEEEVPLDFKNFEEEVPLAFNFKEKVPRDFDFKEEVPLDFKEEVPLDFKEEVPLIYQISPKSSPSVLKKKKKQEEPKKTDLRASQEAPKIRTELNEINDQMRSKNLTVALKNKMDDFIQSYDAVKQKLETMIKNYIDQPDTLADLLRLSDRMDETLERYKTNFEDGIPIDLDEDPQVGFVLLTPRKRKNEFPDDTNLVELETDSFSEKFSENDENILIFAPNFDSLNKENFTCPICFEEVEIGKGYVMEKCLHSYCLECLAGYLGNKISEGSVLNLPCPNPQCDCVLDYYDVRKIVEPEIFGKYEEFCFFAALKSDPNVRWCPNPKGCKNAIVGDPSISLKLICSDCRYEFCYLCNEEYHHGTCEEYQIWKIENGKADKEFMKWQTENAKACPNCKIRIQKNAGCNHITCTNCRYQFCWLCNGKYTSNHYDVYNILGCPGLQFNGGDSPKFGLGKSIAMKALVGTGILVGGAIALPLAIVAGSLVIVGGVVASPFYASYKLVKKLTDD